MEPASMVTGDPTRRPAPFAPASPRPAPPSDDARAIAIDLLRHLDPERVILYDGRRPTRDEWERHGRQRSDYILAATRRSGAARRVAGTLEFRILGDAGSEWGMIDRLYVDPHHRRLGIASRLLEAVIAFARGRGLATLRENIPNVLARDPASGLWYPHTPAGEGWGGLRSLGATVNACVREGQPCAVTGTSLGGRRLPGMPADGRCGVSLALPITRAALASTPRHRFAPSRATLLERLLVDVAAAAGVPPARRSGAIPAA